MTKKNNKLKQKDILQNKLAYLKVSESIDAGEEQNPLELMRMKCLECLCFQNVDCKYKDCVLYKFRQGKKSKDANKLKLPTVKV